MSTVSGGVVGHIARRLLTSPPAQRAACPLMKTNELPLKQAATNIYIDEIITCTNWRSVVSKTDDLHRVPKRQKIFLLIQTHRRKKVAALVRWPFIVLMALRSRQNVAWHWQNLAQRRVWICQNYVQNTVGLFSGTQYVSFANNRMISGSNTAGQGDWQPSYTAAQA